MHGEFLDRVGSKLSNLWADLAIVFCEPIADWPLWAAVVFFLVAFGFWGFAARIAADELRHPTEEQLTKSTFWDRPAVILAGSVLCFVVATSVFALDALWHFVGVWCIGMAYFFLRGFFIQKEWVRLKRNYKELQEKTRD